MMPGFITNVAALAVGGGSPPSATTWSPTSKNSNVVLSNGNLTATLSVSIADAAGIATTSFTSSQLIYSEFTVGSYGGGEMGIGLANGSFTFADGNYLGIDANSVCLFASGNVYHNGGILSTIDGFALGQVVSVASRGGNTWFRTDNGFWNKNASADPAANIGGIANGITGALFFAYNLGYNGTASQWVADFGPTFTKTVPAGFSGP